MPLRVAFCLVPRFLEATERLSSEEREPFLKLYLLVVGAMRTLAEATHEAPLVVDAFLLRALAAGGYEMALTACARCGLRSATRRTYSGEL